MLIFPIHQFINLFNLLILSSIHSFSQHIHPFTLFTCVRFFFLDRFIRKPCKLSHLYFTSQKFEFINKFPEKKFPAFFNHGKNTEVVFTPSKFLNHDNPHQNNPKWFLFFLKGCPFFQTHGWYFYCCVCLSN